MTFDEILVQVIALLRQQQRVSYRALKRRFDLDDEYVADLKAELVDARRVALDEDGKVLVWTGEGAPAPARPEGAPDPSYTPAYFAERGLTTRSAQEGERKQVTVLFADLADSSGLAQQVDPELMHRILDEVLRLMAGAVHRYEGTVNQYLGDGLMALFGAPVALEDHAFRAVQAALTIKETIGGYSAQLQRDQGVEVRLRLGLNTGLVVVGRIGDDLRADYTAVGNTTHLAARMQSLAEPGTILITEATHRLVSDYIRSEPLGLLAVKGQREPVNAYRVTGRRRWRSRMEISAERGLTPLVGRRGEVDLLCDRLTRAQAGRGQVVGIVGEAGVGKSRLLFEFHASLAPDQVVWLTGHCVAHGQATPYEPLLQILRSNAHVEDGDNPLQIQEKLRRGVYELEPRLKEALPFLEALFGLPGADDQLRHLEPKQKRQRTFEAICALALAGSQRRPHVLVCEDLHWIDQTSEDCLAMLVESLPDFPILLVVTHRPGYPVRWADKTYYTQIAPDLLTSAETEAIVSELVGSRLLPSGLQRLIQDRAGGNPLFIEEMTRALTERGLLGAESAGGPGSGEAEGAFPDTMQDIIRARIDRLGESVKRTVQTAAVIGREFGLRLLTRLCDAPAAIPVDVETLKRVELIHETRAFPEPEYRFKHAVVQDVAYQSLLGPRRQRLHAAIAETFEELSAERMEEQAAIIAYHYARSAHQDRATRYALLAGDRAVRLHARAEATSYYDQAFKMAWALPDTPEAQRWQIDATLKLATVGVTRQDLDRDLASLERARALAETLGDEPRLAQVLYWLGRFHYVVGSTATAVGCAEQSLGIADRLGDEALAAPPVNLLGRAYSRSALPKAIRMMVRSVDQMRRVGNRTEEATAEGFAGGLLAQAGEFARAFTYLDHGIRLAEEVGNPFAEAANYFYRGVAHEQHGAPTQAIADYEAALRLAERTGDLFRVYAVKHYEGWAHARAGDVVRGRDLLEESVALAGRLGTTFSLGLAKAYLAGCLLAGGELDQAASICEEAIRLAKETDETFAHALAHRLLAEALSGLDPTDATLGAERAIAEAIRVQQEIGARPELARSYLSCARLLRDKGKEVEATGYLTRALQAFREMEMAWDLARVDHTLRARS